ncbi:dihydrofolate reductase family protein [Spirosoma jeollabukense]
MNISLDGYCDHTMFNPSEEVLEYFTATLSEVDLLFFGRVMYQLMFPYWADVGQTHSGTAAENRFDERLTAIDRVVMSRSLTSVDDKTGIVGSHPAEELLKLKPQRGNKISVDSVSLLPELIQAGLIDEFQLIVHPVMVGQGRPLLKGEAFRKRFI